jgi:Alpha-L-fucosidase
MNEAIKQRTKWFTQARFGLFLHWGLYAIPAQGEWFMTNQRMAVEEYEPYFHQFNPVDYNPQEWAKMAKEAGMEYAVLTAKHHDGFCLFDSALTDYKSTNTKAGRDLVREFLEAFRAQGLKVGLYYSLLDWHHPNYPKYADAHHPMRGRPEYKEENVNFDRYLEYMHGQVKELVTNYGKLDILWFDFAYDNMAGETWKATELMTMVRRYQPHVVVDNRLEGSGEKNGSIITDTPSVYSGDFASPEQIIPPHGMRDLAGNPIPWELCATMNNHWGYCSWDKEYKTSRTIIRKLVECVSKGGNMILNVGPDAKGNFPEESQQILKEIGHWMGKNKESIYGCGLSQFEKPEWGRYTQRGSTVYAHVYETPLGALPLYGIKPEEIESITYAATGSQVNRGEAWNTALYSQVPFVTFGENPVYSYPLPDETDTVLKIQLKQR